MPLSCPGCLRGARKPSTLACRPCWASLPAKVRDEHMAAWRASLESGSHPTDRLKESTGVAMSLLLERRAKEKSKQAVA